MHFKDELQYLNIQEVSVMSEKRCYTVKELQAILGVSRPSVYELLKKDVFRSFIVGGKHIISKSSFDEWLDGDSRGCR